MSPLGSDSPEVVPLRREDSGSVPAHSRPVVHSRHPLHAHPSPRRRDWGRCEPTGRWKLVTGRRQGGPCERAVTTTTDRFVTPLGP